MPATGTAPPHERMEVKRREKSRPLKRADAIINKYAARIWRGGYARRDVLNA